MNAAERRGIFFIFLGAVMFMILVNCTNDPSIEHFDNDHNEYLITTRDNGEMTVYKGAEPKPNMILVDVRGDMHKLVLQNPYNGKMIVVERKYENGRRIYKGHFHDNDFTIEIHRDLDSIGKIYYKDKEMNVGVNLEFEMNGKIVGRLAASGKPQVASGKPQAASGKPVGRLADNVLSLKKSLSYWSKMIIAFYAIYSQR